MSDEGGLKGDGSDQLDFDMKYSQLQSDDVKMEIEETKVTPSIEEIGSTELSGLFNIYVDVGFHVN